MKTVYYITSLLCCMTMLQACSSEEEIRKSETKVPLEINIGNSTRSVIEGTTIPTQTSFGIFGIPSSYYYDGTIVEDINNVSVFYDGKCTLQKDIWLDNSIIYLRAYYPYKESVQRYLELNVYDQIDYLYGESVLQGHPYYVSNTNPKTDILFKHILSRITFKVRHTNKITKDFKLYKVSTVPVCWSALFDVLTRKYSEQSMNGDPQFKIDVNVTEEFSSFDLLMIPFKSDRVRIGLSDDQNKYYSCNLLNVNWEAGQQYTYEITFDDSGIKVGEVVITPWEPTTQSGIDITDNNLVTD